MTQTLNRHLWNELQKRNWTSKFQANRIIQSKLARFMAEFLSTEIDLKSSRKVDVTRAKLLNGIKVIKNFKSRYRKNWISQITQNPELSPNMKSESRSNHQFLRNQINKFFTYPALRKFSHKSHVHAVFGRNFGWKHLSEVGNWTVRHTELWKSTKDASDLSASIWSSSKRVSSRRLTSTGHLLISRCPLARKFYRDR